MAPAEGAPHLDAPEAVEVVAGALEPYWVPWTGWEPCLRCMMPCGMDMAAAAAEEVGGTLLMRLKSAGDDADATPLLPVEEEVSEEPASEDEDMDEAWVSLAEAGTDMG